jgi:hypothetical protein
MIDKKGMNIGQNRNGSGEGRSTRRKTRPGVILTKTTSTLTGGGAKFR